MNCTTSAILSKVSRRIERVLQVLGKVYDVFQIPQVVLSFFGFGEQSRETASTVSHVIGSVFESDK